MIHQIFAGVNIVMASEGMGLAAAARLNKSAAFEDLKVEDVKNLDDRCSFGANDRSNVVLRIPGN